MYIFLQDDKSTLMFNLFLTPLGQSMLIIKNNFRELFKFGKSF